MNENPYGNGTAIFTRGTEAPPGSFSSTSKWAWWVLTFRSRFPSPITASADGKLRFSLTCTCTGPKACSFTHQSQGRNQPVARSRHH